MKTNFVKKGSEKNIEKFEMTNEELATINGGIMEMVKDEDGNWVFVFRKIKENGFFSKYRD